MRSRQDHFSITLWTRFGLISLVCVQGHYSGVYYDVKSLDSIGRTTESSDY